MRKIKHPPPTDRLFAKPIAKTLIEEFAGQGLIIYLNISPEDLKQATGLDRVEAGGKYLSGLYPGDLHYTAGDEGLAISTSNGVLLIEYEAIMAVSLGDRLRVLGLVRDFDTRPEGYPYGHKLAKVTLPAHTTLQ